MRAAKKSTEEIVFLIASAFLRQRYPLSELGMELKEEVQALFATGKIPIKYLDILPTVENPRLELFADFNLSPEEEREVFGWRLSTIQTHKGCTHQCTFCYKNAGRRLIMMPFAAVAKIAKKKREFEKRAAKEWLDWEEHLRESGIIDLRKFWLPDFLKHVKRDEITTLAKMILQEWELFSPKVMRVQPFLESMPAKALRKHFLSCVPINYGSIHRQVFNYEDNDPLDYRDVLFLHRDGTPADYGDVFQLMSIALRPITVTTAGWFSEDRVACRAIRKVIKICEETPELNSGMHRISVSLYERHAIADLDSYLDEIERMIREAAPLRPLVNLYYDKGDIKHHYFMSKLGDSIDSLLRNDLGIKDKVMITPISFRCGRAVELRHEDDYEMWDPDGNIDGMHIRPDGQVYRKPDMEWRRRKNKKGNTQHLLLAPEGSVPGPTGMRLFNLLD